MTNSCCDLVPRVEDKATTRTCNNSAKPCFTTKGIGLARRYTPFKLTVMIQSLVSSPKAVLERVGQEERGNPYNTTLYD